MMQIDQPTDQAWIEPKDVDRYWHLQPMKPEESLDALAGPSQTVRRQRTRRAQFSAIGSVNCKP